MIVVTGGAGFIGSNLVHALNAAGHDDIWVVDDLTDGHKFANLADARIADYSDRGHFLDLVERHPHKLSDVERIFHLGACAVTTEWNGKRMLEDNHEYSKRLFEYCAAELIPFVYASSAAIYGVGQAFSERPDCERPVNVYGWSKLVFDQYVRRHLHRLESQVLGLRYFNVYGPREGHKGAMASVVWHLAQQARDAGSVCIFAGCDGYADGEQRRDFVSVDDVNAVHLWAMQNPHISGVFNCGTGVSRSFNELARAVAAWFGGVPIRYREFPEHLVGAYQSFTCADLTRLRAAGCPVEFQPLESGVPRYLDYLRDTGVLGQVKAAGVSVPGASD